MDTAGNTVSSDGEAPSGYMPVAALVLAFDADKPLERGTRYLLDVGEVVIGRGSERRTERKRYADRAVLDLRFTDARMSSRHACLERRGDAWFLVDQGSKNGARVNGEETARAQLADGDVLELGATFFVFRVIPEDVVRALADDLRDRDELAPSTGRLAAIATLNAPFEASLARTAKIARSKVSIILRGETGTGKEVVARAIHEMSGRRGSFTAVNCGALPQTLVEAELFGSKKGAFSGSTADREGLVRSAEGGTLLLDEIGDLPLTSQTALLRVLQEAEVVPIGGTQPVRVDVRVLAATHRDLAGLVAADAFREDLLARLSGFDLEVPRLRDRIEDLGLLIARLVLRIAPGRARDVVFTRRAARALFAYGWPRNIRELEKCLEAALVLAAGRPIELEHLAPSVLAPAAVRATAPARSVPPASPEDEERRARLVELLRIHNGNLSAVARDFGKARFQVQRWVKRYALRPEDYR